MGPGRNVHRRPTVTRGHLIPSMATCEFHGNMSECWRSIHWKCPIIRGLIMALDRALGVISSETGHFTIRI